MAFHEESCLINAMPMQLPGPRAADVEFGEAKVSSVPRVSGGKVPVIFNEANFKRRYLDEYTGEELPFPLIRAAIEDELTYFNDKVWQLATKAEMDAVPESILVRCRWVLCNKGDSQAPDVRARLVATEVNKDTKNSTPQFAASTPPLEGSTSAEGAVLEVCESLAAEGPFAALLRRHPERVPQCGSGKGDLHTLSSRNVSGA